MDYSGSSTTLQLAMDAWHCSCCCLFLRLLQVLGVAMLPHGIPSQRTLIHINSGTLECMP